MTGRTTYQIKEVAAQAASLGSTVLYVTKDLRHADYCSHLAHRVLGTGSTNDRFSLKIGRGSVRFVSRMADPWPHVLGHRGIKIIADHAVPQLPTAWLQAIHYSKIKEETEFRDEHTRRTNNERNNFCQKLWGTVVRFFQ